MKRSTMRVFAVVVTFALLLANPPITALAYLSEVPDPVGVSATNPGDLGYAATFWRQNWGNSLYPEYSLALPSVLSEIGRAHV